MEVPSQRTVADRFKAAIRSHLTPEQLVVVDRRNNARADGSCATHDFCDANMVMVEALVGLGLDEDEVCSELVCGGPLLDAVNDGWTLARVEGFHPQA